MSEADLLEANRLFASSQVALRNGGALIAGEVVHRSAPELGSQGLAQRSGHRTPTQFIKVTTGATGRDAGTAVRVGTLMREAATEGELDGTTGQIATPSQPWLVPVTDALAARSISIESAEAIRAGLGAPNSAITDEQLRDAADQLCMVARTLDPDAVAREARAFRDELDLDGVALREEERRAKRSLKLYLQPDGTTKLVWIMDPETAAVVVDIYDRATSPKLGGVRFVDPQRQAHADAILTDTRTAEQIASDGFEQLLKLGADAKPDFLLGSGAPVIRLTSTKSAFERGFGIARIEGQVSPLAIKWGGCAFPGCNRPPSWTEAHHIVYWSRDKGRTDLADGILLCRHHHLLCHNNGWEIQRDKNSRYRLIPPAERDPHQTPIELVSKSGAMRDLRRELQPA
jgi:hypothetical protein